ncbi:MAG TPA: hypothetical protein VND80_11315 [Steroidobacteraceae bacterium]|nr:hypothetical protein [Steroidobacteraceae bacterium]
MPREADLLRALKGGGWALLAACILACPWRAAGAKNVKPDPNGLAPQPVRDLAYGNVLFYDFQGEDFAAITRLLAAKKLHQLPRTGVDAELLLGGLYLSLGEHVEAGRIFEELLAGNAPRAVQNRAWYYLGKIWFDRGYFAQSQGALERITGTVAPRVEDERTMLLGEILLREGRFADAVALLRAWRGPPQWAAYVDFNLGIALIREGHLEAAVPFLDRVGTLRAGSEEFFALKDRANLALGYAFLQAKRPADATAYLERVRLAGPYSSKALLGFGWAEAMTGHYRRALVPWLALRKRDLRDAAVQESFLAVPYAFAKLHADGQAARYNSEAIASFDAESKAIDASIATIRSGKFVARLLAGDKSEHATWDWQLRHLPNAPESRYLYDLLASNDFQEGLRNTRDLEYMRRNLGAWRASIGAFDDMIATKRAAYAERVPQADAALAATHLDALLAQRDEFESRLDEIDKTHDVVALATPAQRRTWDELARIGAFLAAHPHDPRLADMRGRYRLMRGVMYWRLTQSFQARLWNERRAVHELDASLKQTERRVVLVRAARRDIPSDTGADAVRVAALGARIDALRRAVAAVAARQERYLGTLAIDALERQQRRIGTYEVQARFALAAIYDRTVNGARRPAGKPP